MNRINLFKTSSIIILLFTFFSCSNYPDTPEKVVEKFVEYMSSGECTNAFELCTQEAQILDQAHIDGGCKPYKTSVDSIKCDIQGNEAVCFCYENHQDFGKIKFVYELVLENDKWKLKTNGHDNFEGF